MNKLFLTILLMSTICSCNPINRIKKDIAKSEQSKADLAKLCTEEFPILPISYMPGAVDTNQIVNSILGSLDKLCPEYLPQNLPNKEIDRMPFVKDLVQSDSGRIFYVNNSKLLSTVAKQSTLNGKVIQTIKDSLIAALKKGFQPDTLKVKDSAQLVALRNDNKQLLATNTDLVAQHAADQHFKDLARTRLWMFIAVCVALVASNGFWIYSKFKL